ncbi:MAG: hypothetical protein EA425_03735 [Puniceicoccaceae bacterium]|nr:MAG: hypothetical protein EA425_03735 [Puniceicoccaceae bacterium]
MPPPPSKTVSRDYRVRPFEAGVRGNLKFVALLNYLQDAAVAHAGELGVDHPAGPAGPLAWVLVRYHVALDRYPYFGDTVRVTTWAQGWRGLLAVREFAIEDAGGGSFGAATSGWALVDTVKRRPVRPWEHLPTVPLAAKRMIEDDFAELPASDEAGRKRVFEVRMHDLDVNGHVNNAIYVEWALESVPAATWDTQRPFRVEAHFRKMGFRADRICCYAAPVAGEEQSGREWRHRLVREADGVELARLRTCWRALDRAEIPGFAG